MFTKIMKTRNSFLEVTKVDILEPFILDRYDFSISDDENTYNKYVTALNFLIP